MKNFFFSFLIGILLNQALYTETQACPKKFRLAKAVFRTGKKVVVGTVKLPSKVCKKAKEIMISEKY